MADDLDVRRAAKDVSAKLHRKVKSTARPKLRKAVVLSVNSDNTVDIMVPSDTDPSTGDTYPRVHRLGSYQPIVGDVVWFQDQGHARYLVMGSEVYSPVGVPVPQGMAPYQAQMDFFAPPLGWVTVTPGGGLPIGSMSSLWYPRFGSDVHAALGRIVLANASTADFTAELKLDSVTLFAATVPPTTLIHPFFCDVTVLDGSFLCGVVTASAEDVRVAAIILDMVAI